MEAQGRIHVSDSLPYAERFNSTIAGSEAPAQPETPATPATPAVQATIETATTKTDPASNFSENVPANEDLSAHGREELI